MDAQLDDRVQGIHHAEQVAALQRALPESDEDGELVELLGQEHAVRRLHVRRLQEPEGGEAVLRLTELDARKLVVVHDVRQRVLGQGI